MIVVLANTARTQARPTIKVDASQRGKQTGEQAELGIPAFTPAHGTFELNWDAARRYAQQTLAALDFSKRDLVIYVPGTGSTQMYGPLEQALQGAFTKAQRPYSVATLQYEASAQFRQSVPTGIAALRLVMAAIAAHPGQHRVTLVGISQGAWIGAEVLADASLRKIVDRAVLVARPSTSLHRFDRGEDSAVIEFSHPSDFAIREIKGDPTKALDTSIALLTGGIVKAFPNVLSALSRDPSLIVPLLRLLLLQAPVIGGLFPNPHDYEKEMPLVAAYLAGAALGSTPRR